MTDDQCVAALDENRARFIRKRQALLAVQEKEDGIRRASLAPISDSFFYKKSGYHAGLAGPWDSQ